MGIQQRPDQRRQQMESRIRLLLWSIRTSGHVFWAMPLPATFQAMMNEIFADMDDVVVVYIDDLMIFTKTDNQAEHD